MGKKLALDQLLFLPFYIGAFIVIMGTLRREKMPEIKEHLERDTWPILKTSYGIWPAVQAFSFYFVPSHQRVIVINFVGLIWNTYLSWRAEKNVQEIHMRQMEPTDTKKSTVAIVMASD